MWIDAQVKQNQPSLNISPENVNRSVTAKHVFGPHTKIQSGTCNSNKRTNFLAPLEIRTNNRRPLSSAARRKHPISFTANGFRPTLSFYCDESVWLCNKITAVLAGLELVADRGRGKQEETEAACTSIESTELCSDFGATRAPELQSRDACE